MTFAKQVREHLGVSQREFAKMLGVSRVSVIRWEKGSPVTGPALAALRLIDAMPEKALDVLLDGVQANQAEPTQAASVPPAAPTGPAGGPAPDVVGAGSPPPSDRPSAGAAPRPLATPDESETDLGYWGPQEGESSGGLP